jgi:hypothetical protein
MYERRVVMQVEWKSESIDKFVWKLLKGKHRKKRRNHNEYRPILSYFR